MLHFTIAFQQLDVFKEVIIRYGWLFSSYRIGRDCTVHGQSHGAVLTTYI